MPTIYNLGFNNAKSTVKVTESKQWLWELTYILCTIPDKSVRIGTPFEQDIAGRADSSSHLLLAHNGS